MTRRPPVDDGTHVHADVTVRSELEGVRQEVLEDLSYPLRVRGDGGWQPRVERKLERETFRLGDVMEGPLRRVLERGERDPLRLHRDRARLDLRQVEDVVDEGEQIRASR